MTGKECIGHLKLVSHRGFQAGTEAYMSIRSINSDLNVCLYRNVYVN